MHCMFDSQLPLLQVATKLVAAAAVANVAIAAVFVAVAIAAPLLLAATSAALIRRRRTVKLFDILTSHLVANCSLPHMPACCMIFNTFAAAAACGKLKTPIVRGEVRGGGVEGQPSELCQGRQRQVS